MATRFYVANYWLPKIPSRELRLWFYRNVMNARIGKRTVLAMGLWIDVPSGLRIGNGTAVGRGCRLDSRGGLVIGDNVTIESDVCILSAHHDIASIDFRYVCEPVVIEDEVVVKTRALILPGVTIGKGSVILAGAVVTKNIDPGTIVAGVPARPRGALGPDRSASR